jgi:hypothetical protein
MSVMEERLVQVARVRGGVFTSTQASALDVDDTALTRMRGTGDVVRVRRDAYVLGDVWSTATPEQRLALRSRSLLATRPGDVASHQSALALHGLPLHGVDLRTVDVMATVSRVRLASGLRTHPRPAELAHVVADGYRCVDIPLAVAQVCVRSGLLAAMVPLDAALHDDRCSLDDVTAALASVCRTPRLRSRANALVTGADASCESVGETRTRVMLTDLGLPVRSQVELRDHLGTLVGRVDFLVGDRVVVEFDGVVKYDGVDGRCALVAEKRREDGLRALGCAVVRVTWADLADPGRVVAQIRRAMTGSSAPDGRLPAS